MTAAKRKAMLRRELDTALDAAAVAARAFRETSAEVPAAPTRKMLRKVRKAATDLYLSVGRAAGFATLLEREG